MKTIIICFSVGGWTSSLYLNYTQAKELKKTKIELKDYKYLSENYNLELTALRKFCLGDEIK